MLTIWVVKDYLTRLNASYNDTSNNHSMFTGLNLHRMQRLHHLYNRFGFGLSPEEWMNFHSQSLDHHINRLFAQAKKGQALETTKIDLTNILNRMNPEFKASLLKEKRIELALINIQWIGRMVHKNEPALLERMCLFWHGHFACRIKDHKLARSYLNTIREHGLGHFGTLVKAIAREPSMIRYLNNQQNRKQSPNENFARELLELFTIGKGAYTEKDVAEAARAFTGWTSTSDGKFYFRSAWHDYGQKSFMGQIGNWNGDDIIDIILSQSQTAHFIGQKIYQYFVDAKGNPEHEAELAQVLLASRYDIEKTMLHLAQRDWFYDKSIMYKRIKSPVDLIVGLFKTLDIQSHESFIIIYLQKLLGQTLFNPPNVAGWPGDIQWIDNATLMSRLNLAQILLLGSPLPDRAKDDLSVSKRKRSPTKLKATVNLKPLIELGKASSPEESIKVLSEYLLPGVSIPQSLLFRYHRGETPQETVLISALRLMSMPDYQMC